MIEAATDAVEALRDAVDRLLAAELSRADGAEVAHLLERVEGERRRLDAVTVRLDAAAEERRVVGDFADCSLTDLLMHRLHIDAREARLRAERAAVLGPRRSMLGAPLPAIMPATAAELSAGEISAAHADVVIRYTEKVDDLPGTDDAATAITERLLLDVSRDECPRQVARMGEQVLARIDPDGTEPRDELVERSRSFSLVSNPDGSWTPRGRWTPELTALWQTVFDALAAPQPEGEEHDPRTPAQRRHDAMLDAAARLLRGDLPASGGVPATMLVRVTVDQLPALTSDPDRYDWDGDAGAIDAVRTSLVGGRPPTAGPDAAHLAGVGHGCSAHGGLLPLSHLGAALCEVDASIVAVDPAGAVLAFGRSRRLASRTQRLALAERDGGCSFPGCTRPPAWCEVHHVTPWQNGGATDLANLCLVCPYHHRHFERLRWSVRMARGAPEWIPPPWLDPYQRPRRNTIRHLSEVPFDRSRLAHR